MVPEHWELPICPLQCFCHWEAHNTGDLRRENSILNFMHTTMKIGLVSMLVLFILQDGLKSGISLTQSMFKRKLTIEKKYTMWDVVIHYIQS